MIECTESNLFELAYAFRRAIEDAVKNGEFSNVTPFDRFPSACCGHTCHLLGKYLSGHGINTYYVYGTYIVPKTNRNQSHAWLQTENNILIDITGDQFYSDKDLGYYSVPVYVGPMNKFLSLFKEDAHIEPAGRIPSERPNAIKFISRYYKIMKYIK